MNLFLQNKKVIIDKILKIMKKLSTIKCRALLKKYTHLKAIIMNETRYSSCYEIIERYSRIIEPLNDISNEKLYSSGLINFLLNPNKNDEILEFFKSLTELNTVTLKLQDSKLTMCIVRDIFDYLIEIYPEIKCYLANDSKIVECLIFENALVKIQKMELLTLDESLSVNNSLNPVDPTSDENDDIVTRALNKSKKCKNVPKYINIDYIPPKSNIAERFFSKAKLLLTDRRQGMTPETLENILYLNYNRKLWRCADSYKTE
ncbi:hypothetical protein A3Q56_01139 [Intoshia linei]|uniref:HAT C-terminal dimerisation domain-containing protein n=1 Tax=Intoshia linei TaxID=1819745 RepID=A0A177BCA4_9BILA|nr:hypothetical protein A3Q56_01139 [Intoshia linei]